MNALCVKLTLDSYEEKQPVYVTQRNALKSFEGSVLFLEV